MSEFGEILGDYLPNKERDINIIFSYFDNPTLLKVKNKDSKSIYAVKIHSLLSVEKRFLIVVTPENNNPPRTILKFNPQNIDCIQTRSFKVIPDGYGSLPEIRYTPKRSNDFTIPLNIIRREKNFTEYSGINGLIVTLLHDGKNIYTYGNDGNLVSALETFNSIITFKEK